MHASAPACIQQSKLGERNQIRDGGTNADYTSVRRRRRASRSNPSRIISGEVAVGAPPRLQPPPLDAPPPPPVPSLPSPPVGPGWPGIPPGGIGVASAAQAATPSPSEANAPKLPPAERSAWIK